MATPGTSVDADPRDAAAATRPDSHGSGGRVAALDGVRGVAVLLVLVGHAFPRLWLLAATGVTIFFVLSGYLITGILLRDHTVHGRVNLRRFYVRRAFRLAPTLLLVLSATVVWCVAWKVYQATLARDAFETLTYRANWGVEGGDFTVPLAQTWSLSVEEQFYLVWPVLLLLLGARRRRLAWVAGALALLSLGWRVFVAGSSLLSVLYGSVSVAFALLVGCLVACVRMRVGERWWRPTLAVAVLLVPASLVLVRALHAPTSMVVAVLLPVVAVATALTLPRMPVPGVVSLRPLVWFGGISYSLYLWQTPIEYNGLPAFTGGTPAWLVVGLAVPLAWLTTRFVERPLTQLGRRVSLRF